jgi:hypothetical protein
MEAGGPLGDQCENLGEVKNSWRRKYNIKEGELEAANAISRLPFWANQHMRIFLTYLMSLML